MQKNKCSRNPAEKPALGPHWCFLAVKLSLPPPEVGANTCSNGNAMVKSVVLGPHSIRATVPPNHRFADGPAELGGAREKGVGSVQGRRAAGFGKYVKVAGRGAGGARGGRHPRGLLHFCTDNCKPLTSVVVRGEDGVGKLDSRVDTPYTRSPPRNALCAESRD